MTIPDSAKDMLKKVFPKPLIPQKRYVLAVGIVVYFAMKAIVAITPSPDDDAWPDKVKDFVMTVVSLDGSTGK